MSRVLTADANIARSLRNLYYVRAAFNIIWVTLVSIFSKSSPELIPVFLIIYPIWDVLGTLADININRGTGSLMPQYVNLAIGIAAGIAVAITVQNSISSALIVFGIWAVLAGVIQLVTGIRRQKQIGGQWPIIISGGQSTIGGLSIILFANDVAFGLTNLAGYSSFGAFYFILGAISMGRRMRKGF